MRALPLLMLGMLFGCGAVAAETSVPGNPDTIHVNAMRDPEVRKYAAIVAGLDEFKRHHGLAPAVGVLRFRIEPRAGKAASVAPDAAAIIVRLEGDDGFVLPLQMDTNLDVVVRAAKKRSMPTAK